MFKTPLKCFVILFKKKFTQRHPIYLTDSDYDYILYEMKRQEKFNLKGL